MLLLHPQHFGSNLSCPCLYQNCCHVNSLLVFRGVIGHVETSRKSDSKNHPPKQRSLDLPPGSLKVPDVISPVLSRPNNSQSRKSTPSFTDSCYVWSTNNLPFPPAHMCIYIYVHTPHTLQPPAPATYRVQSVYVIQETLFCQCLVLRSERTQNLPATRTQGNTTLAAEREGMGRGCPPLTLEDPLKHVTDNTKKSTTEKTLCLFFCVNFPKMDLLISLTYFSFLKSQILIS